MDEDTNQLPDRWLGCPPTGELIDDTFLPIKTLLEDHYPVPEDYKFTPQIFMDQARDRKFNVGLVINLTFSRKYYNGDDLIDDHNVEYRQIACRGHGEAPQPNERAEFTRVCKQFLARNPNKIIVVHCTHGYNRTGFMICHFLVSERDWGVDAAIGEFANKRPPGIYKQDYINVLVDLYGDADDQLTAPPKPIWDSDQGIVPELLTADGNELNGNSSMPKEFYEGINDVVLVSDRNLRHQIYRHCCALCKFGSNGPNLTFPGAQPVSMDRNNINLLKENRYRVSWKADGCRFMLYIRDEGNIFFLNRRLELWRVNGMRFPVHNNLNVHLTDTLVDGEMITDSVNGQKIPRFLIYDVISINGRIVAQENFDNRCGIIKNHIVGARQKAKKAMLIDSNCEPFKVADKGFFCLHHTRKTWSLEVFHEKDGLIFQPVDAPYTGGTCNNILKWKPPSLNSVDFKIIINEERQAGCLPEELVCLHVSSIPNPFIKFKPARDQKAEYASYNKKICEMTLDMKTKRWKILRERTDKTTANSFETARSVMHSIQFPVTEEMLFKFIDSLPKDPPQR